VLSRDLRRLVEMADHVGDPKPAERREAQIWATVAGAEPDAAKMAKFVGKLLAGV
jgi:hypothetical protein